MTRAHLDQVTPATSPPKEGGRSFVNLSDLGPDMLVRVLDLADRLKAERGKSAERPLAGKQIALVFEKSSTRTRLSLEVAVNELGGDPIVITSSGSQIGRGEPVEDTARVLGRMVDAITLRTFDESRLLTMIEYCGVPVLNALTDQSHPMQLLADLQTIRAHFGSLEGLRCAWVGDGNNMASSWIEAAGLTGIQLTVACPKSFEPPERWVKEARESGASVRIVDDPKEAVRGVHVVSTDVFASMGQEAEAQARLRAFSGFCVDSALMRLASENAVAMHCLPAHRGEEISAEVLDGPQSIVWDQAEARLHTAKAILLWALDRMP